MTNQTASVLQETCVTQADGGTCFLAAGVVVVFVMLITTLLLTLVMPVVWRWHLVPVLAIFTLLFAMEGVYLSAVLYQVRSRHTQAVMPSPVPYMAMPVLVSPIVGFFEGINTSRHIMQ